MQVDMPAAENTNEAWQREVDAILARSRELLSSSQEHRERVDRTVAEATGNLRRALLQLRRAR